jgi:hypothetical protein
VRARDGALTTFDGPGASQTFAYSINPAGMIAGLYFDASSVSHGFVRAPDGTITTFDVPGAGTGPGQGTGFPSTPGGLNPAGAITGAYLDASNVIHGYVRASDGTIATFDVQGAGTGAFQGPFPQFTASRAPLTAPSPPSMLRARAQAYSRVPSPLASTRLGRSSDCTLMRITCFTASSRKASKPRDRFLARRSTRF